MICWRSHRTLPECLAHCHGVPTLGSVHVLQSPGALRRAHAMAQFQQYSSFSPLLPHSHSWEVCTVTGQLFLAQWIESTDSLTLRDYSRNISQAAELAPHFLRHWGECSGKVVDSHLISTSIFSQQIKLLIFPHVFLFNEKSGGLYLCMCANKTSQQGLLNCPGKLRG